MSLIGINNYYNFIDLRKSIISKLLCTTFACLYRINVPNYSARKINFKLQLALLIRNRKISLGAWWRLLSMGFCLFREKI